jgi:CRP-like cAMP-binding protein
MISPELVRRYPFFWCINDGQQKAVAMIAEDVSYAKGAVIFAEGQPANTLYLLIEGNVSLCLTVAGDDGKAGRFLYVDEISPGEPFGISSMVESETYNSYAQATGNCRMIKVDAVELRRLMTEDCAMGFCLLQQMGKAALERLRVTHIKLAAAQS